MFVKSPKILLTGIPSSGKTTFLYKVKLNEVITTYPTLGLNVESIQLWNEEYIVLDLPFKNLRSCLQGDMFDIVGIIHLCRNGSQESKNSIFEVIDFLKSKKSNVPILVLMNSEEKTKPPIPQNYAEYARKLIDYPGKITFEWFSLLSSPDARKFLMEHFLDML